MALKPQHPADRIAEVHMVDAIRAADHFLASLFVGRGIYRKAEAPTVLAAIKAGKCLMDSEERPNARPIYYAVGKDGRATMLTQALIDRLLEIARRGVQ
jgi:hypothetical protein